MQMGTKLGATGASAGKGAGKGAGGGSSFWLKMIEYIIGINVLIKFLFNLLILILLAAFLYVVYYCIFVAYPRMFYLGHTESKFDEYMEQYFADLIQHLQDLENAPSIYNNIAGTTAKTTQEESPTTNQQLQQHQQLVDAGKEFLGFYMESFDQDLTTTTDFAMSSCLPLHILIMFYDDLKNKERRSFGQIYDILKSKIRGPALKQIEEFYSNTTFTEVGDAAWTTFTTLYGKFQKLRDAARAAATEILSQGSEKHSVADISTLLLDIMLQKYFDGSTLSYKSVDSVQRMYQLRQVGGFANFRLVGIYIKDYVDFTINQKIKKEIWEPFPEQMRTLADRVLKKMASDQVLNWFKELPMKLAGEESFKNSYPEAAQLVQETFAASPYSADVKEPFVDSLIKMANTFVALFTVITSIINVIADPVAFIKFIIGTIIAIILYIIYFILMNLQIPVAIAYVVQVSISVFETIMWSLLIGIFVIFYGTLSVLDMPMGGFIMRSLRCENLPDAWSKVSNWHNGNKYTRTFLCSTQCKSGFAPAEFGPLCESRPPDEPVYAPHQVIYNTFKQAQYLLMTTAKTTYSHTPNLKYFSIKEKKDQEAVWQGVFAARASYIDSCKHGTTTSTAYSEYDPLVKHMCGYFTDANMTTNYDKITLGKINDLCASVFCNETTKESFCTSEEEANAHLVSDDAPPKKDLIKLILFTIVAILVIFVAMYFLLNTDKTIIHVVNNMSTTGNNLEDSIGQIKDVAKTFEKGAMLATKAATSNAAINKIAENVTPHVSDLAIAKNIGTSIGDGAKNMGSFLSSAATNIASSSKSAAQGIASGLKKLPQGISNIVPKLI